MDRTKAIFDHVFSLSSNNENYPSRRCPFHLSYISTASGLEESVHKVRVDREKESLGQFQRETRHLFYDMKSLHVWLFTVHAAYASKRLLTHKTPLSGEALKSY